MAQALPKSFNRAVLDSLFYAIDKGNIARIGNLCRERHPLQVDEIARIIAPLLKGKTGTPANKQIWKTEILRVVQGPRNGLEKEALSSTKRIFQVSVIVEKILTFCSRKDMENLTTVSHVFHRASLSANTLQIQDTIRNNATLSLAPEIAKEWKKTYGISFEEVLKEYVACSSSINSVEIDPVFLYRRYIPVLQRHFSHATRLFLFDEVRKNDLNNLLKCFPKLEYFEILSGITKQYLAMTVTALETHCKSVTSIGLIDCSDASDEIIRLAWSFPKLRRVMLTDCTDLEDKALIALAQYCPELETFCIPGSSSITDESVLALVRSKRKMKNIDVSECGNLTALPLCELINHSKDTLKSINLESAKKVDIGLIIDTLKVHCPQLTDINFTEHDLTDELILPLIRLSPHLCFVNLSQCTKITDKTIRALASHCLKLTRVDVSGSLMSDECLGLLAELPHLVDINITGCASVTNKGIVSFCARKRELLSLRSGRIFDHPTTFAIANFCPHLVLLFGNYMINRVYLTDSPNLRNELIYKPITPWGRLLQTSFRSLLALTEKDIDAAKSELQTILRGLTQEDRALIYYHFWQFNNSPKELEWGEKNALKDLYKFNTALHRMFTEMNGVKCKAVVREIEYRLADVPHISFRNWRKEIRHVEVRAADAHYMLTHSISDKGL